MAPDERKNPGPAQGDTITEDDSDLLDGEDLDDEDLDEEDEDEDDT